MMAVKPSDVLCGTCRRPSIVVVNDEGGCRDHIDDAMSRAVGPGIHLLTEIAHAADVAAAMRRATESPLGAPS